MPRSYLDDADKAGMSENCIFLAESHAAACAGDHDAEWEWLALAELPAHALMSAKRLNGPDWIRSKRLRTETAEKAYGADWLDRQD